MNCIFAEAFVLQVKNAAWCEPHPELHPCRGVCAAGQRCLLRPLCCRSKVLHSVKRILNRVLAEAFAGWQQHAQQRQQERLTMAQVAQLPRHNLARRSWGAWWEAYQQRLKLRATAHRLMHGMAIRVLHHWQVHL